MEFDTVFTVLVVASFLAAAFNAAFSIGGAMIILAATAAVLPVIAIVPLHSTMLIGSSVSRLVLFHTFVRWPIVAAFLVGSVIGTALGAKTYFALPEQLIAIAIAVVMLVAIWLPEITWRPSLKHPWVLVGFLHSLLSTLFAYGAVLHAVALHAGLKRRELIATMAGCLTGMSVFKIAGYSLFGFDYLPYLNVIIASFLVSFLGTWVGKRLSERLPEDSFRLIYRLIITLTAIRLIYVTIAAELG